MKTNIHYIIVRKDSLIKGSSWVMIDKDTKLRVITTALRIYRAFSKYFPDSYGNYKYKLLKITTTTEEIKIK